MILVYVAGKMTDADPLRFLRNLNRMQEWTARLRDCGMAPFPVADDYADIMRTSEATIEDIKRASLAWMLKADCVFVTPDWEGSRGTYEEIQVARRHGIPVFFSLEEMDQWVHDEGSTTGRVM